MKKRNIVKAIAFCLTLALMVGTFASCDSKSDAKDRGDVLAEVNGDKIYYDDSLGFAKTLLLLDSNYAWDQVPEEQREDIVRRSALNVMIDDKILRDYMKKEDVITSDAETQIKTGLDNIKADATLGPMITDGGITDEMIEEYFKFYFYTQAFMDKVDKDDPVTDEEVRKFYDENKDDAAMATVFMSTESMTASHILIKDAEHSDESKAKAEEVLAKVKKGEDFAELAKEYSGDTASAESGGDLGEFSKDGSQDAAFEAAAFALKKGKVSDIIETESGYDIIKATSNVTPAKAKTLDEAREGILPLIQEEHVTKVIEELREKANVKYVKGLAVDDESLVPTAEDEVVYDALVDEVPTEEAPDDGAVEETPEGEDAVG